MSDSKTADENPPSRQCACVDADAITCYRMRYRTCEFSDSDDSFDGECECSCHAHDEHGNRLYPGDLL